MLQEGGESLGLSQEQRGPGKISPGVREDAGPEIRSPRACK
jgi:hypothetical protein